MGKRRNMHLAVTQFTDLMQLQEDYESCAFLILSAEVLVAIALVAVYAKVITQILKQSNSHSKVTPHRRGRATGLNHKNAEITWETKQPPKRKLCLHCHDSVLQCFSAILYT